MNFLVVGQGGREHAIVRALKNSSSFINEIHALPGNSGIASDILCHDVDWRNFEAVYELTQHFRIDVVVIGPEDPLVQGLSDFLRERKVLVFGPSQAAAQLEGSKVFSKEFMLEFGVSTAPAKSVRTVSQTMEQVQYFTPPYVLKADGLAAGKGVVICKTQEELQRTAEEFFEQKRFGMASEKALLEQFLPGYELSLLLLTDGERYEVLPLAEDHKQLFDGDQGPNTGGMGTVAPRPVSDSLMSEIKLKIIEPTMRGLRSRQLFYRGVIFLGLMVTEQGPQLLEYNCRWGDPETQVILPLLDGDWGQVFYETAKGQLPPLRWKKLFSACVVLAAPGYPDSPIKGLGIQGDLDYQTHSSYFLHAGTLRTEERRWQTAGGRVLCSVGLGNSDVEAIRNAYAQSEKVSWEGLQKRSDIGRRSPATK